MDILDKKILCELDMNCRQSASGLQKQSGSSRAVVGYRIANFEKGRNHKCISNFNKSWQAWLFNIQDLFQAV